MLFLSGKSQGKKKTIKKVRNANVVDFFFLSKLGKNTYNV